MLRWRLVFGPILIAAFIGLFTLDARSGPTAPYLLAICLLLGFRSVWELVVLMRVRSFEPGFILPTTGCLAMIASTAASMGLSSSPMSVGM